MFSATMNIRVDSEVKRQAETLFSEFGLSIGTAVNIFLRQSIRQHGIPFELKLNIPNAETIQAIEEAEILLSDPNAKRYKNTEELFAELNRA